MYRYTTQYRFCPLPSRSNHAYLEITLAEARVKAFEANSPRANGLDPKEVRERQEEQARLARQRQKGSAGLTIEITKAICELGLTQAEASQRMGLTQPKVSALLRGEFSNFSERKLMNCLNRLGTAHCRGYLHLLIIKII